MCLCQVLLPITTVLEVYVHSFCFMPRHAFVLSCYVLFWIKLHLGSLATTWQINSVTVNPLWVSCNQYPIYSNVSIFTVKIDICRFIFNYSHQNRIAMVYIWKYWQSTLLLDVSFLSSYLWTMTQELVILMALICSLIWILTFERLTATNFEQVTGFEGSPLCGSVCMNRFKKWTWFANIKDNSRNVTKPLSDWEKL